LLLENECLQLWTEISNHYAPQHPLIRPFLEDVAPVSLGASRVQLPQDYIAYIQKLARRLSVYLELSR